MRTVSNGFRCVLESEFLIRCFSITSSLVWGSRNGAEIVSNWKLHSAFFHFITSEESTMKIKLRLVMEFHGETRNAGTLERFNKFYAELAKLSEYSNKFMNVSVLLHRSRRSKQKEALEGVDMDVVWLQLLVVITHLHGAMRDSPLVSNISILFSMASSRSNVPCSSSIRIVNWNNSITKMFSLIF